MKVLIASTSTNNTDTVINSLAYLAKHEITVFRYDEKWHHEINQVLQNNPGVQGELQAGRYHLPRERVGMDAQLLKCATDLKPDCILYISAWEGDFVPALETLGQLNSIAPLVHFCFDGSDPPWWPQLQRFEELGIFALTVNIDGGQEWPGLGHGGFTLKNAVTLLTPIFPPMFGSVTIPFMRRPFDVGYAGNRGGWLRNRLVEKLATKPWFAFRQRDDNANSYHVYCDFLKHCRVSISVPFTGSEATAHVKGRVIESGYAGACLLEWKNAATAAWFTPRFEYFEYESIDECVEMAEWLAGHPNMCADAAKAFHYRVTTEHSPEIFWGKVFSAVRL